jgi:ATP-dependent Lon protease
MTGEETLTGKVLAVGGVLEKLLAAFRAGICAVVLPKQNRKDLEEVPREVKERLRMHFVENIGEVVELALARSSRAKPRQVVPKASRAGERGSATRS